MRIIAAIILSVSLAACATIKNITPTTLADLESVYGAAEAIAVGYRDSCDNRLLPPSCRMIVPAVQKYGAMAQEKVLAARKFVAENPTVDASAQVAIAFAAVKQLKAVLPVLDANGDNVGVK